MTAARRSRWLVRLLLVTLGAALFFAFGTDGFYGTTAPTLWDALHPRTEAQSDDVYLCTRLNGQGSDDGFGAILIVLLVPSLILRMVFFRRQTSWGEFALFSFSSAPALLFHFGVAQCAEIDLTLVVGRNLPLAALIAAWTATFVLFLLPSTNGRNDVA